MEKNNCSPYLKSFMFLAFACFTNSDLFSQTLGPWEKTSLDHEGLAMDKLFIIDNNMFATGETGLWKKTPGVDEWIKVKELYYANSFVKHKGKYILSSWYNGIWESEDLETWTQLYIDDAYNITSITTDQNELYLSTDSGVFKLEDSTRTFIDEQLQSKSIHNEYFPFVLLSEEYVIALGCDFVYYKAKDSVKWNVMDFQFDRCGVTAENINGEVYFSTSGSGIYQFTPGEFIIQPITSPVAEELKHVLSIYLKDEIIYYLYLTGLYTSDEFVEEIEGNLLNDIICYEQAFYVTTTNNGVWKSTGVIPRTVPTPLLFNVKPSLSNGEIYVELENLKSELYLFNIIDVQGRLIKNFKFDNQYNYFTFNQTVFIDSPGMYFIQCITTKESKVQKVIIID